MSTSSELKLVKSKRTSIPSGLRHEVYKRDNYSCRECGVTKRESILHIDHIIPISKGGADELSNLQTLCAECNLAKSNSSWEAPKWLICPSCEYGWFYKGRSNYYCSCPRCRTNINIRKFLSNKERKEED